jgi:inner membrane protein
VSEEIAQLPVSPKRVSGSNQTFFKIGGVSILIFLLLIPLSMIGSVLTERLFRRDQTISEITATWGKEQVLVGPVMNIPYRYPRKVWKEETINGKVEKKEVLEYVLGNAFFLPETLAVQATMNPNKLHRGIYDAVVYSAHLTLSGQFARPDFESFRIPIQDVYWQDASITFAIPDLRGVREVIQLSWGDTHSPFTPGTSLPDFSSGMQAKISDMQPNNASWSFQVDLTVNGSNQIRFAPVGTKNMVKITSNWPDPSFKGAFLPMDRKVTPAGFEAVWQVSYYGRDYPQQWRDQDNPLRFNAPAVEASLFGVAFLAQVDSYRNVERSIKYGILFIILIFAAFFLFEVLAPIRIHPFQYLLVGAGLCLFYLALLSLSEFISFARSYLIAASICSGLISLYSLTMLRSGSRTLIIAGELASIYGFLYAILQMQDYSLLFGTIGLFIVLAMVMYFTRNIDWYARDSN